MAGNTCQLLISNHRPVSAPNSMSIGHWAVTRVPVFFRAVRFRRQLSFVGVHLELR